MATQRYSVTPQPIETLLTWIKSGEVAIPEIQRPFVWDATKVRNLLDSLYRGYPVGYLIAWKNPSVRLKDGTVSSGKRILIDGQQRVTALMAALLGHELLTKDYEKVRIRIAFHPVEKKFEVSNQVNRRDPAWIGDVAALFAPDTKLLQMARAYCEANSTADEDELYESLERLRRIINNHVGIIDLAEDLDIETVTEIFIRVNSAGAELSQADFAMSKIAANESHGGNQLRKAIDYFCHLAIAPDFFRHIEQHDPKFAASDFYNKMSWLKNDHDDIYDPSYTDMLRVAFTSEFQRGKLQDLVALLSGRNFETKQYEDAIAEQSFARLKKGVLNFINQTHFQRFVMIMRSAGFVTSSLIRSKNAVNFAYIIYLCGRADGLAPALIETLVRRWYVMSVLTGRYSGTPETAFDLDIRYIAQQGLQNRVDAVINAELNDSFWSTLLPQQLDTSSRNSPYFLAFQAAQIKMNDKGFLSRDITVQDLIMNRSDVHHVYPQAYLKRKSISRSRYNQIANFVLTQTEINIAIGDRSPADYFQVLIDQCHSRTPVFGAICNHDELRSNLESHCIPAGLLSGQVPEYEDFLLQRRHLMADKLRRYFDLL